MRYIGGKTQLLEYIKEQIPEDVDSIIDLFSGSGAVANFFKEKNYTTYSNDLLYFSYVLLRGELCLNKFPDFKNLGFDPINYLNSIDITKTNFNIKDCFIYQNYTPHDECKRMYFQPQNGLKIDLIRLTIEKWKNENKINEDEYFYLLSSLLQAVPFVANITGVYSAYLKFWDARTYKELTLQKPKILKSRKNIQAFNMDCKNLLKTVSADLLYADPPYNSREYLPNYHILETIAKYDYPKIKGVTGMREYSKQKSDFCSKAKVKDAFENMIKLSNSKYILISYNNEGLISTEDLSNLCQKYAVKGTFKLTEIDYKRYKSKIPNNKKGLYEQLYFFEKKPYNKSPMNYIGGKYKLLGQIIPLFPNDIKTFVDMFAGGGDVFSNVKAEKVVANDINYHVIEIYKMFQQNSIEELLKKIDAIISEWDLNKTNQEGYLSFREHYNKTKDPLELYVLINYSFNYQIRFNSAHEYNNPFGKNRSSFNSVTKNNLINFHKCISKIIFSSFDYNDLDLSKLDEDDFVYCDPPYTITTGSYNDGKRGFNGWSKEDDKKLFNILDELNNRSIKFALSNVIEHKGTENLELIEWAKKYNVHYLNFNYNNSSYNIKDKKSITKEVLITNY